jgi:5-methylcytosine-specific restriction endonuclease McrA
METLILSATWEPIGRVDWQRAMTLWWSGRAELVEAHQHLRIQTVSSSIQVPAVLRYVRGRHRRVPVVRFSRHNVFLRDEGSCQYCGIRLSRADATYDHVVPRRSGGATTWDNIVLSCRCCNQRKGGRTPEQAGMPLRTAPVRPRQLTEEWFTGAEHDNLPESWQAYLPAVRRPR